MSSTTKPPKRGRPRGQPKAERRLKRELSKQDLLAGAGGGLRDVAVQWLRAGVVNPIIAPVTAIITANGLYRTKLIDGPAMLLCWGLTGLIAGGTAVSSIANAIANDINAVTSIFHIAGSSPAPINDLLSTGIASYTEVEADKGKGKATTSAGGQVKSE